MKKNSLFFENTASTMQRQPVPHPNGTQLYNLAEARVKNPEFGSTNISKESTSSASGSTSSAFIAPSSNASLSSGVTSNTVSLVSTPVPSQSTLDCMETNCSPTSHLPGFPKANEYLDQDDVKASKHILAKLCRAVVENTCYHSRKIQGLNEDKFFLQDAINNAIASLNENLQMTKISLSSSFIKKLDALDEQMLALEAVAGIFKELDAIESILNSSGPIIKMELETVDLMKKNLETQNRLIKKITDLEAKSFKHKAILQALDYGNPKMLQNALREEVRHYGTCENEYSTPFVLAEMISFQRELNVACHFYQNCQGLPIINFAYINNLIEEVKEDLSENITFLRDDIYDNCGAFALSPASSSFTDRIDSIDSPQSPSIISSSKALEGAMLVVSSSSTTSGSTEDLPPSIVTTPDETYLTDISPLILSLTSSSFASFKDFTIHMSLNETTALSNSLHTACSIIETSINDKGSPTVVI